MGKSNFDFFSVQNRIPSLALNGRPGLGLEPKVDLNTGSERKSRRRCTKIKLTRAVELRSSKFWKFWKAEVFLFHLSTTFPGLEPTYLKNPPTSKKNKQTIVSTESRGRTRGAAEVSRGTVIFGQHFSGVQLRHPSTWGTSSKP